MSQRWDSNLTLINEGLPIFKKGEATHGITLRFYVFLRECSSTDYGFDEGLVKNFVSISARVDSADQGQMI